MFHGSLIHVWGIVPIIAQKRKAGSSTVAGVNHKRRIAVDSSTAQHQQQHLEQRQSSRRKKLTALAQEAMNSGSMKLAYMRVSLRSVVKGDQTRTVTRAQLPYLAILLCD